MEAAGSHLKFREDRLRAKLDRMGYRLMKAPTRDPDDITYGGYQIADLEHGSLVAGFGNAHRDYAFDLNDVERWIRQRIRAGSARKN